MAWFGKSSDSAARAPIELAFESTQEALGGLLGRIARLKRESRRGRLLVAFTAPETGAGCTTLAACCALGLTRLLGIDSALVEANPYEGSLARYLDLPPGPGLREILLDEATLADALRRGPNSGLHVLPAGAVERQPAGALSSPILKRVLTDLTTDHGVVLLDAPALLEHPDAALVLEHADAAVLVLAARGTRKADARRAVDRLGELGVPVLGSLFNRYRTDMPFGLGDPDAR